MKKKIYEKPELKGAKLFEAGATSTCCKTTTATCTNNMKTDPLASKNKQTSTTS